MQVPQGEAHVVDDLGDKLYSHRPLVVLQTKARIPNNELQDGFHKERLVADQSRWAKDIQAARCSRLQQLDASRILSILLELYIILQHFLRQELQDLRTVGREAV